MHHRPPWCASSSCVCNYNKTQLVHEIECGTSEFLVMREFIVVRCAREFLMATKVFVVLSPHRSMLSIQLGRSVFGVLCCRFLPSDRHAVIRCILHLCTCSTIDVISADTEASSDRCFGYDGYKSRLFNCNVFETARTMGGKKKVRLRVRCEWMSVRGRSESGQEREPRENNWWFSLLYVYNYI